MRRQPGGINPLMAAAGLGSKEEDSVGRNKTRSADDRSHPGVPRGRRGHQRRRRPRPDGAARRALQGYDDVVQFLVEHGAKIDIKDQRGFTALDAAEGKAGGVGFDGGSAESPSDDGEDPPRVDKLELP